MILTGLLTGFMTFVAFAALIEKMNPTLKALVYGHYLFSDILFTALSFFLLPVVGIATLISAATFCILFSLYLTIMHNTRPYAVIRLTKVGIPRVVWNNK